MVVYNVYFYCFLRIFYFSFFLFKVYVLEDRSKGVNMSSGVGDRLTLEAEYL